MGEFEVHAGVGGFEVEAFLSDGGKFAVEVFIGEGAGVLEIAQAVVGEEMQIAVGDDGFEGLAAFVGDTMLGA